jgi:hypothetical protein
MTMPTRPVSIGDTVELLLFDDLIQTLVVQYAARVG